MVITLSNEEIDINLSALYTLFLNNQINIYIYILQINNKIIFIHEQWWVYEKLMRNCLKLLFWKWTGKIYKTISVCINKYQSKITYFYYVT